MNARDGDEQSKDEREVNQNVKIGGDVKGDVNVSGGDIIKGDLVKGDEIRTGDIVGSKSVAIGRGGRGTVTEGVDQAALDEAFSKIESLLEELRVQGADAEEIDDANAIVQEIKAESEKGEEAQEGFLAQRFRNIARIGPDILDVVTASLVGPIPGISMVLRKVAEKARQEAGLES